MLSYKIGAAGGVISDSEISGASVYWPLESTLGVSIKTVASQAGSGTPLPSNVRAIQGKATVQATVGGTAYALTPTSTLYGLVGAEDEIGNDGHETHRSKLLTFDGTQAWTLVATYSNTLRFAYTPTVLNKFNVTPVCSHFAGKVFSTLDEEAAMIGGSQNVHIKILKSRLSTADPAGLKAWLAAQKTAGTPVQILFQIDAPTTTYGAATPISVAAGGAQVTSDGASVTVAASVAAGAVVNWTPGTALAYQITSAMAGVVMLTLQSYLDGILSSTVVLEYALNVPASYLPSVAAPVFSILNPTGDDIGIYVQGRSRSICAISASSVYGASIVEYRLTIGGKTYVSSSSSITTDVLSSSGVLGATVEVVDSRGQAVTRLTESVVTVNAYFAPMVTAFSVVRALADGTLSNDGTYIRFTLACVFAPLANKNTRAGSIKFKVAGGTFSVPIPLNDAMTALGVVYSFSLTGLLGSGSIGSGSYVVSASLTDRYTTGAEAIAELASRKIYFDLHSSGEGMAIGKVAETASLFDVGIASRFRGAVQMDVAPVFIDKANTVKALGFKSGTVTFNAAASSATVVTVTFDSPFSVAPHILFSLFTSETWGAASYFLFGHLQNITVSGFQIRIINNYGSVRSGSFYWQAVGT